MIIEQVVMQCFKKISSNRSATAVYHLITGKKSIQTIQDAKLFQLEDLYGIYRPFKKTGFYHVLQKCRDNQWLEFAGKHKEQDLYIITDAGNSWLQRQDGLLLSYYKGRQYENHDELFLKRLYLLIQTLSNTAWNEFNFIPIVDDRDTTNWVKQTYAAVKGQEKQVLKHLYHELVNLLETFDEQYTHIFIDRLTGHQHYGQSVSQLSEVYRYQEDDIYLILIAMVHRMLTLIHKEKDQCPIMGRLIQDQSKKLILSKSAMSTYKLIKKGLNLQQIEQIRQLKLNTIYDHIVEIAINDKDFQISPYVSETIYTEVMDVFNKSRHARLKDIKENVHPEITYFQIRLVLAKMKH